jgi:hypothetical protein
MESLWGCPVGNGCQVGDAALPAVVAADDDVGGPLVELELLALIDTGVAASGQDDGDVAERCGRGGSRGSSCGG